MILIIGIPNSGKTTYSSQYGNCIHYDEIGRTTRDKYRRLNELASQGNAVIEGVINEKRRRKELISSCPKDEHKVCIWLNTPLTECLKREQNYRKRSLDMVRHHHERFEPPTYDEGWDEIIIIGE